jgi:hypothetical protein
MSQYVSISSILVGLATRHYFLSECCCLVSVGRPLWREDGSAICSVITQWSESRTTRNHILPSHLRLPPTWRARFPYLYPPGSGLPSYTPGHWVWADSRLVLLITSQNGLHGDHCSSSFIWLMYWSLFELPLLLYLTAAVVRSKSHKWIWTY